jgi:hypothetical protein
MQQVRMRRRYRALHYWSAKLRQTPMLCSACDPKIAKWHGQFPQEPAQNWINDRMVCEVALSVWGPTGLVMSLSLQEPEHVTCDNVAILAATIARCERVGSS